MKSKKNVVSMRSAVICAFIFVMAAVCLVGYCASFTDTDLSTENELIQTVPEVNDIVIEQPDVQADAGITQEEPHSHIFVTMSVRKAPTCTEEGESILMCHCGATQSEMIPVLNHEYRHVETYEATCTHAGYMIYQCICGDSKKETLPQENHNYLAGERKEATCTSDGYILYVCKCGDTKTETLPKVNHTFNKAEVIEATCVQEGKIINRCECGFTKYEAIAKKEHVYKLTSTVESTTTVHGKSVYTCKNCTASYTETLPLKPPAMYTDMCGDSLINKALPHDEYKELATKMFDIINNRYTLKETAKSHMLVLDGYDATKVRSWIESRYRYISIIYYCTLYRYDNKPAELLIWGDNEVWSEMDAVQAEVKRVLAELGIDNTVTQYEAIKRINDYVCESMYYEYDNSCRNGSVSYSMFGKSGVCHNYALRFQLLCLGAGIECEYFASSTMNHAWNKVIFSDGTSYWVDTCWNDAQYKFSNGTVVEASVSNGVPAATVQKMRARYLLIDTATLLKTHSL